MACILRKNPITKLYVYEFEPFLKIIINYEESFVTLKNIWLKKITQMKMIFGDIMKINK